MRVGLRDVAKAAGVSVATASHVINQTGSISEATRLRVAAVAERIGYQRNPALSAIAAHRFRGDPRLGFATCAFFQLVNSTRDRLNWRDSRLSGNFVEETRKFGIVTDPLEMITTPEALARRLQYHRNLGTDMLVIHASSRVDWLDAFDLSAFIVVGLEDVPDAFPFDRVEQDWGYAVRATYAALRNQGYGRIGAAIRFHGEQSQQDRIRLGAYAAEWLVDHPDECPPQFTMVHNNAFVDPRIVDWADAENLDAVVVFPLRYAYELRDNSVRNRGIAVIQKSPDPAYRAFPGICLDRHQVVVEAARVLYDMKVHGRKGKPANARVIRIRGAWAERV